MLLCAALLAVLLLTVLLQLFLRDIVGDEYTPSVGWQVDPFGHSAGHARVLSDAGCDACVNHNLLHCFVLC